MGSDSKLVFNEKFNGIFLFHNIEKDIKKSVCQIIFMHKQSGFHLFLSRATRAIIHSVGWLVGWLVGRSVCPHFDFSAFSSYIKVVCH